MGRGRRLFWAAVASGALSSVAACSGSSPNGIGAAPAENTSVEVPKYKPVGSSCESDAECEASCTGGACTAPSHTDGRRSPTLGETDVDCGGPTAPTCAEGLGCSADGDCVTNACGASKRCVAAPSCKGAHGPAGVDTCGAPGAPESCCRALALPTTADRRLDKFEITAGRVRAFIDALSEANAGNPNVRAFAKGYAASHPTSQLGEVATRYPGLLDVLPDHGGPSAPLPLTVHLGVFPLDPMNELDGCFTGPGSYGHATYWQPESDLAPYGVGNNGVRAYAREVLDAKPVNCVMPLLMSAFCAWDGGELARTRDYHEIWGRRRVAVGSATVFVPWAAILPYSQFNWRNGHGGRCPIPWPGCVDNPGYFATSPADAHVPADDDSPAIAEPGRFTKDVTEITSASGEGWFDVGGNLTEAAWPTRPLRLSTGAITDVCDVSAVPGAGERACSRRGRAGVVRFDGALPHVAIVGYSFEGHNRRSEVYLASDDGDESRITSTDMKPVTFQYGKTGARCARPAAPR